MTMLQEVEASVDVYITGELSRRAPKTTDYLMEKLAIQDLAARMADNPGEIMPRLVDLALEMTGSVTGGLSLFEPDPAPGIFRWHHLRGRLEKFTGETTPRMFSPCGVTLDRNSPVLCKRPERTYTWLQDAEISLPELLLVPLYVGSVKPIGTLWLVSQDEDYYDSGHARVMTELASFVGIALHVQQTEQNLKRALEHQQTLTREMNHRVKNLFAVTYGMIRVSAKAASSPAEMSELLSGRLHALAAAHDLVRRQIGDESVSEGTELDQLLRKILNPHEDSAFSRFEINGPPVHLGDRATNGVAMVFHELATNAAKHGALTLGSGRINVSWTRKDEYLLLHWQENGGPQIMAAPIRKGFGSTLTHNTIVRELGGTLDYDWRPDGLSVDINVPIQNLST
ncbi:HWE histidine kinase domain-containing protein [Mesorhizobium sp. M0013]|uniref:HWE histidine kinase domain-containing protein n=1 Tax=Mesorhizobium sp. M0013 TaxID=2956841 RepID=UPI0033393825